MDPLVSLSRGKRTLLETLDALAHARPHQVFASVPLTTNIEDGFRDITINEISRAVDSMAHWIKEHFGRSNVFETVAFLSTADDPFYAVIFFALQKCGYKAFFFAPGMHAGGLSGMVAAMKCTKCIYTGEVEPVVRSLHPAFASVQMTQVPSWEYYRDTYTHPFAFHKPFVDSRWDPVVALHSSGTTGKPRPIVLRNGFFSAPDAPLPPVPGREAGGMEWYRSLTGQKRIYSPAPPYHLSGLGNMCLYPVFADCSLALAPHGVTQDANLVQRLIELQDVKLVVTAPAHIEAICRLPSGVQTLSKLEYLCYAGGPLATATGDMLRDKVSLQPYYGSTEVGTIGFLSTKDWEYLELHPDVLPKFVPVMDSVHGMVYEMVLWNTPGFESTVGYRWTLPNDILGLPSNEDIIKGEQNYHTRDLFIQHPDPNRKNSWRYFGRLDDILVASTGTKLNPVLMESKISEHPEVAAALVIGAGRYPFGLLVEPREQVRACAALVERLWPMIEKAHAEQPEWARLRKDTVAVVAPHAFERTPKGSVNRKLTSEKFMDTIDGLYRTEGNADTAA